MVSPEEQQGSPCYRVVGKALGSLAQGDAKPLNHSGDPGPAFECISDLGLGSDSLMGPPSNLIFNPEAKVPAVF